MSASWPIHAPRVTATRVPLRALQSVSDDGLLAFPSEGDVAPAPRDARALAVAVPRKAGFTMRVARLSPGLALMLAVIVVLGLSGAAAIGVLVGEATRLSPASRIFSRR